MQKQDKTAVSIRELRQVGCGFGLLLCLIGGLLIWKNQSWGGMLFVAAPLLTLAFWFDWPGVRKFFSLWMAFAMRMSRMMTAVLLSLLYFLVLTPTSFLARLSGQHFVEREFKTRQSSYWESRRGTGKRKNCEKQF